MYPTPVEATAFMSMPADSPQECPSAATYEISQSKSIQLSLSLCNRSPENWSSDEERVSRLTVVMAMGVTLSGGDGYSYVLFYRELLEHIDICYIILIDLVLVREEKINGIL
jgi:hypothetical protein